MRATSNDKVVFSGILQPNETKALSAPEKMTLKIGNAGALSISLNGKSIPAVGPRGQVRTVQLLPDGEVQLVPPVRVEPEETRRPDLHRHSSSTWPVAPKITGVGNLSTWIVATQEVVAKVKQGAKGYIIEWAVDFDPARGQFRASSTMKTGGWAPRMSARD